MQGKWVRQVIFVKGTNPKRTGYHVVIDTVEPADNRPSTWRHPWQLTAENPELRQEDNSVVAINDGVALQILPVDPDVNLSARFIHGQEKPALLGWRVYGESAKPWNVPTYEWPADNTFTKAWILQMQGSEADWPVRSVQAAASDTPGEIMFQVHRQDGGTDLIIRRMPGSKAKQVWGTDIAGDVAVLARDPQGREYARLELIDGIDSVAAPRGVPIAQYELNISERFADVGTSRLGELPIELENAGFEQARVAAPGKAIQGWDSNSLNGTGVWQAEQSGANGDAVGQQLVAIHQGGFIGQLLRDKRGRPVAIGPGQTLRVHFRNLPHNTHRPINMGVYLHAGDAAAPQIAQAHSFSDDKNTPGKHSVDLTVRAADILDDYLPAGWTNIPMYLKLHNYAGRVVLDDIRVEVVQ